MTAGRVYAASLSTTAGLIVLWISTDLFLVAAVGSLIVCVAVLLVQRRGLRAECDLLAATVRSDAALVLELDAENMRLHDALTEAQIAAGTVRIPGLRVVRETKES